MTERKPDGVVTIDLFKLEDDQMRFSMTVKFEGETDWEAVASVLEGARIEVARKLKDIIVKEVASRIAYQN